MKKTITALACWAGLHGAALAAIIAVFVAFEAVLPVDPRKAAIAHLSNEEKCALPPEMVPQREMLCVVEDYRAALGKRK